MVDLLLAPKTIVLKQMLSSGVCLMMVIIYVLLTLERSRTWGKNYEFSVKILIGCLIPREGNTGHISWDHKHFIFYLKNEDKISFSAYIFNHPCEEIKDSTKHRKKNVPYGRLLSELFFQGRLIDVLKVLTDSWDLEDIYENILSALVLANMKMRTKSIIVASKIPLAVYVPILITLRIILSSPRWIIRR